MDDNEIAKIKEKIVNDKDFIYSPKYNNSLSEFVKQNPDGVSNEKICKLLLIEPKEFDKLLKRVYTKLRKIMEK